MIHWLRIGVRLRRVVAWSALLAAMMVCVCSPARAYDQVVHHSLVYAAALGNGLSPEEAAIVANGSWSLDTNDTTIAFSWTLVGSELKALIGQVTLGKRMGAELADRLIELPHMRSGQVFHALTSPANRKLIQQAHLRRINRVLTDPREPGTPDQRRHRALLYLGEYLHFVGDTVVHPNDPLVGHGLEGHIPDRGDLNFPAVMQALALFGREVTAFQRGRDTRTAMPEGWLPAKPEEATSRPLPRLLGIDEQAHRALIQVGKAVADSWARTYPTEQGFCNRVLAAVGGIAALGDVMERERNARAASEVNRILAAQMPRPEVVQRLGIFHKIELDSDGEPIAYCRQAPDRDCDSGAAEAAFGRARGIEILPFSATLADRSELSAERRQSIIALMVRLGDVRYQEEIKAQLNSELRNKLYEKACTIKRAVEAVQVRPPAAAAPAEVAHLRMASANLMEIVHQTVQQEERARELLAAAKRETNPSLRQEQQKKARQAFAMRDGLLVSAAKQAAVPLAPSPRQGSALQFGHSPTLDLLRKMDDQYKAEGRGNPLGTFLQNYDGAARQTAAALNRNPGTQFFGIPTATRVSAPASAPSAPIATPQTGAKGGRGEPGGIKFSSTRAADIASTIDISSIAFDAGRGKIVISGEEGSETFDLDTFADVLRLAVEENEPFFSLDPLDNAAWDDRARRVLVELDKKYPSTDNLIDAVQRVSPPPLRRGNRQYFYTTIAALDPELAERALGEQNIATKLVFSPAWLRYSKVGRVLYEADLAIKAVATGFVEQDGAVVPVPAIWKLPGYDPIWAQPSAGSAGRANFELSRAKVVRGTGRIDLSEVHPELYVTLREPGTDRDLPPSPRDLALSAHFSSNWRAYAQTVPEIGRLVAVFRAYVAARFLIENHPGLKARILSFARELPPEQPPVLIVTPLIIRVALENGRPATLDPRVPYYVTLHGGYGGGIAFGVTKTDAGRPRIVLASSDAPPENMWRGLFAAAWYDARVDSEIGPKGRSLAIDFEGGDMPISWHLRLIAVVAAISLGLVAAALILRHFDWQRLAIDRTCVHCARVHTRFGRLATAADIVVAASLGYLVLLPLAASTYETGLDWRQLALTAGLLAALLAVLILLGLVVRVAFDLRGAGAPRSTGLISAMCVGGRIAGLLVALFIFHAGVDALAVGSAVAQFLTPAVAERTFAMSGGVTPVAAAAASAGIAALTGLASRWLLPSLMGSRPLALFSFSPAAHNHNA